MDQSTEEKNIKQEINQLRIKILSIDGQSTNENIIKSVQYLGGKLRCNLMSWLPGFRSRHLEEQNIQYNRTWVMGNAVSFGTAGDNIKILCLIRYRYPVLWIRIH
jgi:hypothetical protein